MCSLKLGDDIQIHSQQEAVLSKANNQTSPHTVNQLMGVIVVFNQRIKKNCFNALLPPVNRVLVSTSVFNPLRVALNNLYMEFL